MTKTLRDYQSTAVQNALKAWSDGHRATLFVCPTGGGKTFVFAELARMTAERGGRTLIIADRELLIDQAADECKEVGLSVGFEQADRRADDAPTVVCATVQSMSKPARLKRYKRNAFDLVVIDEADLGIAPSYVKIVKHFYKARVFGCTATPDRTDKRNLGEMFDDVCHEVEMVTLIEGGQLSRIRRHRVLVESVTLDKSLIRDGDYTDAEIEKLFTQETPLHEVTKPTLELAGARPTIVFTASVPHAILQAEMLNRYRPGCARSISGKMKSEQRQALYNAFANGEFQFLCNCALLLRGVNMTFVSCIAMARPTLSRSLYAQAIGRGTRLHIGKDDLLVIDFTPNSETHTIDAPSVQLEPDQKPAPTEPTERPKSGKTLVSPIDVIAPSLSADVKERAREIVETEQGLDVLDVLKRAEHELKTDEALRQRIRAKVEYETRVVGGKKGIDWGVFNEWNKPNTQIAEEMNISKGLVTKMRRRYAFNTISIRIQRNPIDWASYKKWDMSTIQIAKENNVKKSVVSKYRRRYAPESVKNRKPNFDWSSFKDWDKSNIQIMKITNKRVSNIATMRKKYAPHTITPRGKHKRPSKDPKES